MNLAKSRSHDDLTRAEDTVTGGGKLDGVPRRGLSDTAIDEVEEGGKLRSGGFGAVGRPAHATAT